MSEWKKIIGEMREQVQRAAGDKEKKTYRNPLSPSQAYRDGAGVIDAPVKRVTSRVYGQGVEVSKQSLELFRKGEAQAFDPAREAEEIRGLLKSTAENIAVIGQKLVAVKANLPHGEWGGWLKREFDWSDRTAQNFMNVGKKFKSENFADLDIAPSAAYLLASPSTPEDVGNDIITRAKAGERITHKVAREAIKRHEPKPKPKPEPEPVSKPAKPAKNTAAKALTDLVMEDPKREEWDFPREQMTIDEAKMMFLHLALALENRCPRWLADACDLMKPDASLIEAIEADQQRARGEKRAKKAGKQPA